MRSGKNIVREQDLLKIVIDDILWANNRLASCQTIKSWSWMFAHVQRLILNRTEAGRVPIWIEMFLNSDQKWQTRMCNIEEADFVFNFELIFFKLYLNFYKKLQILVFFIKWFQYNYKYFHFSIILYLLRKIIHIIFVC